MSIEMADRVILREPVLDQEGGTVEAGASGTVIALKGIDGLVLHIDTGETFMGEPRRPECTTKQVQKVRR